MPSTVYPCSRWKAFVAVFYSTVKVSFMENPISRL
jgi:hypothetical protein